MKSHPTLSLSVIATTLSVPPRSFGNPLCLCLCLSLQAVIAGLTRNLNPRIHDRLTVCGGLRAGQLFDAGYLLLLLLRLEMTVACRR
ncbi:MAG: hypothetical protein LBH60_09025 [Prevotellaceae bacterium]|nr:hypothetical protein [Prevotellaceae bacterium]